jgi:hypothetical protein
MSEEPNRRRRKAMHGTIENHRAAGFGGRRRLLIAAAAVLGAATFAAARPASSHALVTFSDGIYMNAVVDCDYWSLSLGAMVKYPARVGYVRFPVYNNDTRRWMTSPGWTQITNGFISSGWVRWQWGRGSFTFHPQVGRYVNGVWVTAWDVPRTCYFI